jgi:hypothetical protein
MSFDVLPPWRRTKSTKWFRSRPKKKGCRQAAYQDATGYRGRPAAPKQLVTRNSRWTPLRRLEINLSHGAAWKALISRYITVIPLIGDEPCIAMQSMSGWPLKKPVHSAMNAKVGAAAKPSQPAAPGATRPPRHRSRRRDPRQETSARQSWPYSS